MQSFDWNIVVGFLQFLAIAVTGGLAVRVASKHFSALTKQLKATNETERARIALHYIADFRQGKYQIGIGGPLGVHEITPDRAFRLCRSLLSDEETMRLAIVEGKDPALRYFILQVASVVYNFCAQTSQLIWKGSLDEDILLDLLWGEILLADEALQKLAVAAPELTPRLDTVPFRLIVALSKKRATLFGTVP